MVIFYLKKGMCSKLAAILTVSLLLTLPFCSPVKKTATAKRKITFIEDIKTIIVTNCGPCHTGGRNSDLYMYADCKDLIDESLLRIRMQRGENGFMPERRKRLPDSLIQVLAQWKADGLLEETLP